MAEGIRSSGNDQTQVLQAFSLSLTREVHVLSHHPDLLWQQMYNRLKWDGEDVEQVLAPILGCRSAQGCKPWLRLDTPQRESHALICVLAGHIGRIQSLDISPDGAVILSAGEDGTLRLWDVSTGLELRSLAGHTDAVLACCFSPDGQLIASCSSWEKPIHNNTVRIWKVSSGELVRILKAEKPTDCAFTPNGRLLVVDALPGVVWEVASGKQVVMPMAGKGCIFSPDGRWIASPGGDNLYVHDANTGAIVATLGGVWDSKRTKPGHTNPIRDCAFSPDGSLIVSASEDRTLRLWDPTSGAERSVLQGHNGRVICCAFSPDGTRIVSGSADKTVRLWDTVTGAQLAMWEGHTSDVLACRFSPDGSWVASAGGDGTIRMWNTSVLVRPEEELIGHATVVSACSFSSDGRTILTASLDGLIKLWHAETGVLIRTLQGHEGQVRSAALSPDGRQVVSAGKDHTLRLWDISRGREQKTIKGHASAVLACAYSPDGSLFASGGSDGSVYLWDTEKGRVVCLFKGHTAPVYACAFSPHGLTLISGGEDQVLLEWRTRISGFDRTETPSMRLIGNAGAIHACAYSPDGSLVATAGGDGTVRLWNATRGEPVLILKGHNGVVSACTFSSDGRLIASAGEDHTVCLWSLPEGVLLVRLHLPGALRSLALHPWLPRFICGDAGGALYRMTGVGIEPGLAIIIAVEGKRGFQVTCPACGKVVSLEKNDLGRKYTCPERNCGKKWIINQRYIMKK